ncbi:uncharacterized protein LOC123503780 [Portunus trituberculatus]|uniref:uncharacterized protein LOC123503780 n=1 Tax=Portunus trituberculatus TaxID=210409 RepID=UPI001E1CE63E|nr:uncharacterized protein LOC123503780 [Portunus trituberculatus]
MEPPRNTSHNYTKVAASEVKIVSANLRGFHTNVGEITHNVIIKHRADIAFVCETFLDVSVPVNYVRVRGYSAWQRKDRSTQGGGVAFCYKETLNVKVIEPAKPVPEELELLVLKVTDRNGKGLLCVGCYRPPSQGTLLIDYLTVNIDAMMVANKCENTLWALRTVWQSSQGLVSRGHVRSATLWKWEKANWQAMRASLKTTDWDEVLCGDTDQQVGQFTELLHTLQDRWVPHSTHQTKASDQPWFGPECRAASDAKYRAWLTFKRHPTAWNRQQHREATDHMRATQEWASDQWVTDLKRKLRGGQVGSKRWWSLGKEQQGVSRGNTIPHLHRDDGTIAQSARDKANLLAKHFTDKMCVSDPKRSPPPLPNICADLLAHPLSTIFNQCLRTSRWPSVWKVASVVPVHKKNERTVAKNYRPVSLLPVLSKVLESIVASRVTDHLEKHHLLCSRQFGFRPGSSAADLHLLLISEWSAALDAGKATAVVALDIEGAFDKVWPAGLLAKLRAAGVDGPLLLLFGDYLRERNLKVVIDGQESEQHAVKAGVLQGSCLGPLLWNIYINDLLHLIPSVRGYADDLTLAQSFSSGEETATGQEVASKICLKQNTNDNYLKVEDAPSAQP